MTTRITAAVVGVGAIGAAVADQLDPRRVALQLCRRRPNGMTIVSPSGISSVGGSVLVEPRDAVPVDWVLLSTKATQDPSAWLDRLVGPDTRVAVLQNGIDLPARVRGWVGADRCVPVVVQSSAERVSPDVVAVRHDGGLYTDRSRPARAFGALFRTSAAVVAIADLEAESWRKLMLNVVVSSVTAITGGSSAVCASPDLLPLTRSLLLETTEVALASGVALGPDDARLVLAQIRALPAIPSSMQTDAQNGRPLEYEFITGAVVQHADRTGLPVPSVRAVHALLAGLSEQSGAPALPAGMRGALVELGPH